MTRKRLRGPLAAVICDVCGRDNEGNLTFCLDCGRRLRTQGRGVPPTPPHGIERVERAAVAEVRSTDDTPNSAPAIASNPAPSANPTSGSPTSGSPTSGSPTSGSPTSGSPTSGGSASSPKPSAPRSRPEAPALQFTVSFGAEAITTCPSCRSSNPPGYRFCVTCGASLGRPASTASSEAAVVRRAPESEPEPEFFAAPVAAPPEPSPSLPAAAPTQPPAPTPITEAPAARPTLPRSVVAPSAESAPATSPDDAGDKIIGAPVVGIATTRTGPPRLVRCARCHGHSAEGMRFCKYCGAPLDEGEKAARAEAEPTFTEPVTAGRRDERLVSTFVAPAPASPSVTPSGRVQTGRLVVIVEDGSEGKSFPLVDRQVDVGRTEGDILLPDDLYVSPRHARLLPQGGHWILRNLHSTNGVYRRIREPHALKDGDLLLLGLEVLQFETVNDAERGLGHATQHGTLLFGSPSTPRRARLCQRTVEGVTRDVYHLFRDETVIGREVGDIVFTADPFLSRRHAVLRRSSMSGEFTITDLDSSNGTYVAIRSDVTLDNGDYLRIGQHLFRVDLS
ncbi:FHA domain-containing protein [Polyangium jinanense]|uniref:FHA domain-containing protein n=1 Tax=Polyangium jinanense TaxID=2829994 RepID=A0A9X3X750_9BACT|nr:FHA domain-containing protein [Polyangium jinanense]MDC3955897.1 FHA domain-containing protein [Polyangium jinanense]MDC3983256.1 FHA domain-containing protein [Polyangium jinanense]MDC3985164.1 FHA domain-containing protein [Polyangium jinanense]